MFEKSARTVSQTVLDGAMQRLEKYSQSNGCFYCAKPCHTT